MYKKLCYLLVISQCLFFTHTISANTFDTLITKVDYLDVEKRIFVPSGYIGITDGHISYVGQTPPPNSESAKRTIDGSHYVALPGFIDTHTHLWQHVAKSFYPTGNLQQWVRIYGYAHYFDGDSIYQATLAAAKQAQLSGITTVSDFASANFFNEALPSTCRALNEAAMGGVVIWWNPAAFIPYKAKLEALPQLQEHCQPLEIWMGQGPLSFFDLPVVKEGIDIADTLNLGISEHTMENVQEQRDAYNSLQAYLKDYGEDLFEEDRKALAALLSAKPLSDVDIMVAMERLAGQVLKNEQLSAKLTQEEKARLKSLAIYEGYFSQVPVLEFLGALNLQRPYLSIHSVWQNSRDMGIYKAHNVSVSHNPGSNRYLSSGVSPTIDYLNAEINWSVGTDGAASNDGINFFRAMRAAWNMQKLHYLNANFIADSLKDWDILYGATLGGAKALGLGDKTGSLTKGKEADVLLLSKNELGLSPWLPSENAVPLLIYGANKRNVAYVFSNGSLVVENGELVGFKVGELARGLTRVSEGLVTLKASGKTWHKNIDLTNTHNAEGYLYQSIRKKDSVKVMISNRSKGSKRIRLAFSGQPFGGAAAPVLSDKTRARFPLSPPDKWWDHRIKLQTGGRIEVLKQSDSYQYLVSIHHPGQEPERIKRTGAPEQVYMEWGAP